MSHQVSTGWSNVSFRNYLPYIAYNLFIPGVHGALFSRLHLIREHSDCDEERDVDAVAPRFQDPRRARPQSGRLEHHQEPVCRDHRPHRRIFRRNLGALHPGEDQNP